MIQFMSVLTLTIRHSMPSFSSSYDLTVTKHSTAVAGREASERKSGARKVKMYCRIIVFMLFCFNICVCGLSVLVVETAYHLFRPIAIPVVAGATFGIYIGKPPHFSAVAPTHERSVV